MPLYPLTAIQAAIHPSSPAELGTERGKLVLSWLTVLEVLAFDLFAVTWEIQVIGEVGALIVWAAECFVSGWPSAYAFSFRLQSVIELWWDAKPSSAFIITVRHCLVGLEFSAGFDMDGRKLRFFPPCWDDSPDCVGCWCDCCCWGFWLSGMTSELEDRSRSSSALSNFPFSMFSVSKQYWPSLQLRVQA